MKIHNFNKDIADGNTWSPLPLEVEIKKCEFGLGVFAISNLAHGAIIGVSHVEIELEGLPEIQMFRTPLGAYTNHADNSNSIRMVVGDKTYNNCIKIWHMIATRKIMAGEQIFLTYSLYDPTVNSEEE